MIISETATPPCFTEAECIYQVRHVQLSDILSLNLTDIGCNFMIGGDGNVYVGRGWDTVGEGLHGYNPISIGICFIGKFDTVEPQRQQLVIAQKLLEFGLIDGKIVSYYQLLGIRQISGKLNPGIALYKIIQTWSHWVDKIPEEARGRTLDATISKLYIFLCRHTLADLVLKCLCKEKKSEFDLPHFKTLSLCMDITRLKYETVSLYIIVSVNDLNYTLHSPQTDKQFTDNR